MPSISGDDRGVCLSGAIDTTLKLFNRAVEDLALRFLAFAIASIQMFSQTARFIFLFRFKQLNDRPRCVHAAGRVNPRPDTEAQIVGSHFTVIAAPSDINERAQPR